MVGTSVSTLLTASFPVPRPPDPGRGQVCENENERHLKTLSVDLFMAAFARIRGKLGKNADDHVTELFIPKYGVQQPAKEDYTRHEE